METSKTRFRVLFKKEVPESDYSNAYEITIEKYFMGMSLKECMEWAEKEALENGLTVYWIEEKERKREVKPFPKDKIIV